SPAMPCSSSTRRASDTHWTMFSASFRHGMTTETRSGSSSAGVTTRVSWGTTVEVYPSLDRRATTRSGGFSPVLVLSAGSAAEPRLRSLARADLHRLRLPLSPYRRGGRALVPQPRRTPGRRGARRDLPDASPVGAGRRSGSARGARDRGRAAACSVLRWPPQDRAAARLRARRSPPPTPPRPPLRHRPHGLVPVLLAAGGRAGAPAERLPAPPRLARALVARVLAGVPRAARRASRLRRAEALPAHPAAGVLLLATLRAPPSRRGSARARGRARRRVRGLGGRSSSAGPARRRVRRKAH